MRVEFGQDWLDLFEAVRPLKVGLDRLVGGQDCEGEAGEVLDCDVLVVEESEHPLWHTVLHHLLLDLGPAEDGHVCQSTGAVSESLRVLRLALGQECLATT